MKTKRHWLPLALSVVTLPAIAATPILSVSMMTKSEPPIDTSDPIVKVGSKKGTVRGYIGGDKLVLVSEDQSIKELPKPKNKEELPKSAPNNTKPNYDLAKPIAPVKKIYKTITKSVTEKKNVKSQLYSSDKAGFVKLIGDYAIELGKVEKNKTTNNYSKVVEFNYKKTEEWYDAHEQDAKRLISEINESTRKRFIFTLVSFIAGAIAGWAIGKGLDKLVEIYNSSPYNQPAPAQPTIKYTPKPDYDDPVTEEEWKKFERKLITEYNINHGMRYSKKEMKEKFESWWYPSEERKLQEEYLKSIGKLNDPQHEFSHNREPLYGFQLWLMLRKKQKSN